MPTSKPSVDTTDRSTGFRGLVCRHTIAVYLALVFGLGYSLMLGLLLLPQGIIPAGTAQGAANLEVAASAVLVFLALFPAALIVTALEGGRPAVVALFRRMVNWRIGAGWWAIVLLALPLTTIALASLLGDTLRSPTLDSLGKEALGFAVGFLGFNYLEEASWSGVMQTRLERRYNVYSAAALTAIPFAGIHMPLQIINGVTAPVRLAVAFLILMIIALLARVFFGLVMRGAANSLLAVGLAHTTFNRSNNATGIAALLLDGTHRQAAVLLATALLIVLLGVILRRRTGQAERARLDDANRRGPGLMVRT